MESIQKAIIMNIDELLKTYTLLGHFLKSTVKSMTYRDAFLIEHLENLSYWVCYRLYSMYILKIYK